MKILYVLFLSVFVNVSCYSEKNDDKSIHYINFENLKKNKIYVRVLVNDSISGLFLLDNGSSNNTIDSTFFYQNFITENYKISNPHNFWWEECDGIFKFAIGLHTFSALHCSLRNLKTIHPDLNGILGIGAFKNKITFINFDSNKIAFADTAIIPADYYKIILCSLPSKNNHQNNYQRFISVDGFRNKQGENIDGKFLFDLGASGGLSAKHNFINKIKFNGEPLEKVATGQYMMIKEKFKSQTYIVDSLYLDGFILLKDVQIHKSFSEKMHGFDPLTLLEVGDGLLGIKILSQFNLIYDERNDILYLKSR